MLDRRGLLRLGGLAAAGWAIPASALPDPVIPGLRRAYLSGPFGQLHIRIAEPLQRRGKRLPPLLLFHQTPLSGRMFERLLPHLADGRVAIAVDTPGYGESDRPASRPTLAGYGDAILAALAPAYGRRFDLLGYHTGAAIAVDLAARRREVRRLVLVSMPLFGAAQRAALLAQLNEGKEPFAADGTHLLGQWTGSYGVKAAGQSIDDIARLVAEKQRAGRHNEWALRSAMELDLAPLLDQIRQPALVIAPHDGLEAGSGAAAVRLRARLIDRPDWRYGLFDAAPAELAALINPFLG